FPGHVLIAFALIEAAAPLIGPHDDAGLTFFGQLAVQLADLVAGDQVGPAARYAILVADPLCQLRSRCTAAHRRHDLAVHAIQGLLGNRADQLDVLGLPLRQRLSQTRLALEYVNTVS